MTHRCHNPTTKRGSGPNKKVQLANPGQAFSFNCQLPGEHSVLTTSITGWVKQMRPSVLGSLQSLLQLELLSVLLILLFTE